MGKWVEVVTFNGDTSVLVLHFFLTDLSGDGHMYPGETQLPVCVMRTKPSALTISGGDLHKAHFSFS